MLPHEGGEIAVSASVGRHTQWQWKNLKFSKSWTGETIVHEISNNVCKQRRKNRNTQMGSWHIFVMQANVNDLCFNICKEYTAQSICKSWGNVCATKIILFWQGWL